MPGVAQVWLTADELHALVKVSTEKGSILSPRMRDKILPKLEEARNAVGCPVPFAQPDGKTYDQAGCRLDGAPGDYA